MIRALLRSLSISIVVVVAGAASPAAAGPTGNLSPALPSGMSLGDLQSLATFAAVQAMHANLSGERGCRRALRTFRVRNGMAPSARRVALRMCIGTFEILKDSEVPGPASSPGAP